MKNMEKYNVNHMTKADLILEHPSLRYSYKKEKKFLCFIIQEEGFYSYWGGYVGKNCPEDYFMVDEKLFVKSYIKMYFNDGHQLELFFNTTEEAEKKYLEITGNASWIVKE